MFRKFLEWVKKKIAYAAACVKSTSRWISKRWHKTKSDLRWNKSVRALRRVELYNRFVKGWDYCRDHLNWRNPGDWIIAMKILTYDVFYDVDREHIIQWLSLITFLLICCEAFW